MKQDDIMHLATMFERVAKLLKSGVKPSDLQSVIIAMGGTYTNGLHYEWQQVIERLVQYYGTDFNDNTFKCNLYDIKKRK